MNHKKCLAKAKMLWELSQGELAVGTELAAAPGIPAPTRKQHVIYCICCSSKFKMFTALLMFYPL